MRAPQYGQSKKRLAAPKLPVENAMLNRVHYHAKRDKRLSRNRSPGVRLGHWLQ